VSRVAVGTKDQSEFFRKVSEAKHRVLLVDYDGTLAPFNPDRHRAAPYPRIPEYLRCIMTSCGTRLIIVSGRGANEVAPLLGLNPPPEIWGTHGIERINAAGRYEEVQVNDTALEALARAEARLEREGFREHLEIKLAAVALHWRGLSATEILNMRTKAYRILEPLAVPPDLVLTEFEEGVEIRLKCANKGDALRNLLSELDHDVPVAYLGDDATDEDAFRVLNGRGLSVLVGPKHRFSAAQMWLKPPDQLLQFLTGWIHACGGVQ
jgi:trehalose 6-phosphate phosphatase